MNYQKEVFGELLYFDPEILKKRIAEFKPNPKTQELKEEVQIEKTQVEKPVVDSPKPIQKEQKIEKKSKTSVKENWQNSETLQELDTAINSCTECPLGLTRNQFVFGTGNPNADLMIIGEAPGADEDAQGKPFVGRAGQLLTKILKAINFEREDVFIANILKCRPPGNRRPEKSEVDECEPYLKKQIDIIKPKFILSLGLTSVDTLLKKKHKMKDTRGKILSYHGIKLMVTYHPAALLRNPNWKKDTWEDVQLLRKLYDEEVNG